MYIPDKLFEKINDPPCTMLFVWLIHLADVNGVVSASYIDIAADIGYSKTQVYRYVQTLSKLGALGTSLERNRLKITITGYDTYKRKPSGTGTKLEQKNERYFVSASDVLSASTVTTLVATFTTTPFMVS